MSSTVPSFVRPHRKAMLISQMWPIALLFRKHSPEKMWLLYHYYCDFRRNQFCTSTIRLLVFCIYLTVSHFNVIFLGIHFWNRIVVSRSPQHIAPQRLFSRASFVLRVFGTRPQMISPFVNGLFYESNRLSVVGAVCTSDLQIILGRSDEIAAAMTLMNPAQR